MSILFWSLVCPIYGHLLLDLDDLDEMFDPFLAFR